MQCFFYLRYDRNTENMPNCWMTVNEPKFKSNDTFILLRVYRVCEVSKLGVKRQWWVRGCLWLICSRDTN